MSSEALKGIPQNGFVLGDPNAPVTLVEYIDLQCPICAAVRDDRAARRSSTSTSAPGS